MTTALDLMAARFPIVAVDAFLRAAVVAAIAAAVLSIWRGAPVRARSWTWSLVLYAAVAMPLVVRALPLARLDVPVVVSAAADSVPAALVGSVNRFRAAFGPALVFRANPTLEGSPRVSWIAIALVVYVTGVVWMLTRIARGAIAAWRIGTHGTVVDDESLHRRIADHVARLSGVESPRVPRGTRVPRRTRVIEQAQLLVPVAMHLRRPVIALPADWREWPDEILDAVLVHELSHIVRGDTRTLWLSRMYRACAWVSPLSWWLHARLADLAEQASDEAALEAGIDRVSYAELLLSFVARLPQTVQVPVASVAMARAGRTTERRIDCVLAWKRPSAGGVMTHTRGTQMAIAVGIAATVGVVASVRLTARDFPMRPAFAPPPSVATDSAPDAPMPIRRPQGPPSQLIESGFRAGAYNIGADGKNPVLIKNVGPKYTPAALARKISGDVQLEVVVLTDGTVGEMRIVKSLDRETGLDDQAARAARQWQFTPALLNGQPVNVVVDLVMEFRLERSKDVDVESSSYTPQPLADEFASGAYWSGETGVSLPTLVHRVDPKYTRDAMRAKVQGSVAVEIIVMPDGTVGKARVVRSLDPTTGLDDEALLAVKQWTFEPGRLNGVAVPVLANVRLEFRLH